MPQAASYDRAGAVPPACGAPLPASDFRAALSRRAATISVITTCSAECTAGDAAATPLFPAAA